MKNILIAILIALTIPLVSSAQNYDAKSFSVSAITTNQGTDSVSLRGEIDSIIATIPTGATATVQIATAEGFTIFTKSMTAATDGQFPVRYQAYNSSGTAQTYSDNNASITNALLTKAAYVGTLTVTIIPAALTTLTNTYTGSIVYSR